jgi:seryl-tRNA synthetase
MLDIHRLREDPEGLEAALKKRSPDITLKPILDLDKRRREILVRVDGLKADQNKVSKEISALRAKGEDASAVISEVSKLKQAVAEGDQELREVETELNDRVADLPNVPHESVPVGLEKSANVVVRTWGKKPVFDFEFKNHVELGRSLGILDFERGAKLAGSQFPLYKGTGALLEMALINFFLTENSKKGYLPIVPPFLVNRSCMYVSGVLSKFEKQYYECLDDPLYLLTTAEVSLANMHRDEILSESDLPIRYTGYSACFRREAGSYGKEERGLIRIHQFQKVEMFKYVTPETSYDELEGLVADAEDLCRKLGLHHRTSLLATGDIAQQSAKTYDVECWLPGQDSYYEVSSCSNCEDYQARRGNIRYRPAGGGKPRFPHMLNGSGLATSRVMVSILECNQQPDGSVVIPEVLRPFLGGLERIEPTAK